MQGQTWRLVWNAFNNSFVQGFPIPEELGFAILGRRLVIGSYFV